MLSLSPIQQFVWETLTQERNASITDLGERDWQLRWEEQDGMPRNKPIPPGQAKGMLHLLKATNPKSNILKAKLNCTDLLERSIEIALIEGGIRFHTEADKENQHNLDFLLPEYDLYIEVKSGHSDRISKQMARHPNVIAVQGTKSTKFITRLIRNFKA